MWNELSSLIWTGGEFTFFFFFFYVRDFNLVRFECVCVLGRAQIITDKDRSAFDFPGIL